MNIVQKDIRVLWRNPVVWVLLALSSFVVAWLAWQMIDQYSALQLSLQSLPNPPTITAVLWVPFALTLAKLLLVIIAFTTGYAMAVERSQNTLWYLLINQHRLHPVVSAKFKAQFGVVLFLMMHTGVFLSLLSTGGQINILQVVIGVLGLLLLVFWLIALGLFVASCCQSTGTAVLANILVFGLMWLLGSDASSQDYGLNWLILISPMLHLKWFLEGQINLSSLVYFIGGGVVFTQLTVMQLEKLRRKP